jgi:hypothetical protein
MKSTSLPLNTTNLPITHPKNQYDQSRKKATHSCEFVANRRLSYNCGVTNGGRYQHRWQLIAADIGTTKLL